VLIGNWRGAKEAFLHPNAAQISITGGFIGFNISGVGGDTGQGIGSVSIVGESIQIHSKHSWL